MLSVSLASRFTTADEQVRRLEEIADGLPTSPRRERGGGGGGTAPVVAAPVAVAPQVVVAAREQDEHEVGELRRALSRANERIDDLEKLTRGLLKVLQLSEYEQQLANESLDPHARVKCLHALPAFSTIIKEVDLLRPVVVAAALPLPPPPPPVVPVLLPEETPLGSVPLVPRSVPAAAAAGAAAAHAAAAAGAAAAVGVPGVCAIGAELTESGNRGVKVVSVSPEGPCEVAGVFPNDVVIAVDNRSVPTRADLRAVLAAYEPGAIAMMLVERHGSLVTLPIMLGAAALPAPAGLQQWSPRGAVAAAAAAAAATHEASRGLSPDRML